MDGANKILWREGLFLTPQHFQALDSYHERLSGLFLQTTSQYYWGFHKLVIDEETLTNWQFDLKAVQTVFRNATVIDCPGTDPLPASRSFENLLTPDRSNITAYLCLPRIEPGRPGVKMSDQTTGHHRPYERVVRGTADLVTGTGSREIEYLVRKPEVRFDSEDLDGFHILPMARIVLQGAGRPTLADNFLPPSLSLEVSPVWLGFVEQLLYQANSKAADLRSRLTYGSENAIQLTTADLPSYLQCSELTAAVPKLLHFYHNKSSHPLDLWRTMADLLARLGVLFGALEGTTEQDFPAYNHDTPGPAICSMEEKLHRMFSMAGRTRENELTLIPISGKENEWACNLTSATFADNEEFYLWARSELADERFVPQFAHEFRMAAPTRIDHLQIYALPGVTMNQVMNPPAMLPAAQRGHYFRIDTRHDLWREIREQREIRVTGRKEGFPKLEMRIHILRG